MKSTVISIILAAVFIGGAIVLSNRSPGTENTEAPANNVSVVQGKQIVDIAVKGGYSPRISSAKAGMPTTLRLETNGTFDCSSAVTIAALGFRKNLSPSGITEVDVPPQKAGTTLRGVCIMGMYSFTINFS